MPPTNISAMQAIDQREPSQRIPAKPIEEGDVDGAGGFVPLLDAAELLAPYRARRFKDLRCPVCGHFACGGC
jgi:hypothetical protein